MITFSGSINLEAVSLMELHKTNHTKTRKRSTNCKVHKIKYINDSNPNRYLFYVVCSESWSNKDGWITSILFEDAKNESKYDKVKPLTSDVRVKCSCPAFQYWGSAYNSTKDGYDLNVNEKREPNIRDPKRERTICKHIGASRLILRNRTFKKMRRQFSSADIIDMPEVSWKDTIPNIESFLSANLKMPKKQIKKVISSVTAENYITFLENYGVIIK